MRKTYLIILFVFVIGIIVVGILIFYKSVNRTAQNQQPVVTDNNPSEPQPQADIPLVRARERVTKKPFGIKISPENSPIQPERFSGYHTGVDYEIFPGEENADVQVFAICGGNLLIKRTASGYGGALAQECNLENQAVTIIYGHIKLSSVKQKIGDYIAEGEKLAVLGKGYSTETDNERKHLHLGIHEGTIITLLGYVQKQSDLDQWIDFEKHLK
jgi:hypothetical protein